MNAFLGNLANVGSHLGIFTQYAIWFAIAAFAVAMLLVAWRLLIGPDLTDRILALDALYLNGIALMVLFGILFNTRVLFEAALIVALLGFISTVVLAKFIAHGDVAE